MINEWDLTQTNQARLKQHMPNVAVLGSSAIEAHNYHLPEGQDFLHTEAIVKRVAQMAWEKTSSVICLPTIPYGVDCNLLEFPLTIHVKQTTLDLMLTEIVASLAHHGIRKIVLINGHGGNDFTPLVRQIQADLGVFIFWCNIYEVGQDKHNEIFDTADDHAGELETSMALALFPELVELEQADSGASRPFQFEALEQGWIKTSRMFSNLNDHCGNADPSLSTAEKGQQYLDFICNRISNFLIELAEADVNDHFPHFPEIKH
ncbi:MAG TPA: creatininase family protein [Candidatus Marinimicrobia bacterium]|jgi:creatinine amidohydrolase|nr:creatininase family protein [Candidatus Neomarinimicrobiota bacterium]HIN26489.1 creatininase family protein [Candidatus Neomarinimicrobiota bacterium]|tara:strand:- start:48 stop:833 length:786 start_codon:yes stop_codon:yes gene_type:complete